MKLDLVGSTVRYEVMELVIDVTGSEEGIYAFTYWTEWRCGQVLPMPDSQTLEDRATQLLREPVKNVLGVVHILRNHFWGSRETPPPM